MKLEEYEREFYSQPNFDFEQSGKRIRRALELIGSGHRVLDIGCWGGEISELIKKQGNQVVAMDISEASVERARELGIEAHVQDIAKGLGMDGDSFDVVYMGDILEHLFDVKGAMREAHRVLKVGGRLVITTINICSLRDRILLLTGSLPAYYGTHEDHIRLFNKARLVRWLTEAGFRISRFEGLAVEMPYWRGRLLRWETRRFPTLSSQFVIEAVKDR
ncbi:MAG: methyltransferase domain-containing protein [Candidatus Hydrothermarchaeota archaeon]